jgi:hypothetical protein
MLDERFIQILQQNKQFSEWPAELIVPDRDAFLEFLQERWPLFLDYILEYTDDSACQRKEVYGLKYPGPAYLPFDHDDIRIYIDNYFLENLLQPVTHPKADLLLKKLSPPKITVGLLIDPEKDNRKRLQSLLESLNQSFPPINCTHHDWCIFAYRLAQLYAGLYELESTPDFEKSLSTIQAETDTALHQWLAQKYSSLYNHPPSPPVMVHHIPRYITRSLDTKNNSKICLIVMDGMAIDQWLVLRDVLSKQNPSLKFKETAAFAWIPTITSVSRQALFSGKIPLYFTSNIISTDNDSKLWSQFWEEQGIHSTEIFYKKGLHELSSLESIKESLSDPKIRVVGLVVDTIDKIMHGMQLGTRGMHNQVHQWATQGMLIELLNLLLDKEFFIYITSDHGNIEAQGVGSPSESNIADLRGERVRIYNDDNSRANIKTKFPGSIDWPSIGLPDNYLPLLAPPRKAFVTVGDRIVSHGGISIEELIVPFIEIERRTS